MDPQSEAAAAAPSSVTVLVSMAANSQQHGYIEKYSKSFCEESKKVSKKKKEHMAFFFRQQVET